MRFVAVQFTPTASVFKGERCGACILLLTDRERCRVVDVGLLLAETLSRLYPQDFNPDKMSPLLLDPPTLVAIKANRPLAEIRAAWQPRLAEFLKIRAKHLLY